MSPPVVIIHSLEHAVAAAEVAAELDRPLLLASAPGAAAYLGPAWLPQVIARARARAPAARVEGLLDCGDRPGDVMAALAEGVTRLRFSGRNRAGERLAALCTAEGAELYTGPLTGLDLLDTDDPAETCRAWLRAAGR